MKIVWTVRAGRDLRAVRAYIAQDSPTAAADLAQRILTSAERLTDFPASGRPGRKPDTRELVVPGTPYILPYRIRDRAVEILGVIHAARRWTDD